MTEKSGLLRLGWPVGQPIDWLTDLGIASRVDEDGDVAWRVFSNDVLWINATWSLTRSILKKHESVLTAIFRSWESFERAIFGFHVPDRFSGGVTDIDFMIDPRVFNPFEKAHPQIQRLAYERAVREYLGQSIA